MRSVGRLALTFVITIVIGGIAVGACLAALVPGTVDIVTAHRYEVDEVKELRTLSERTTVYWGDGSVMGTLGLQDRDRAGVHAQLLVQVLRGQARRRDLDTDALAVELQARRDLFYEGIAQHAGKLLSGKPPRGAFYAFLKIDPAWQPEQTTSAESRSWAMAQHLITRGRIGCVPGADFGANGEGYIRFCFARSRQELLGALGAIAVILNAEG